MVTFTCEEKWYNEIMKITNKITGRDVTKECLALMQGVITIQEFELLTLTIN